MQNRHTGKNLPEGYVRENFYLCYEGKRLIGVFSLKFELTEFLLNYGKAFDARDYIIGEQLWNFADFGTIQGPMRADGNKKGLFTRERRPKLSAHAMRQRWSAIPDFGYKS